MSDIELPDLPPLKTVAWQITNDDISYWTAVRDRSAASAIKDEHELAGFPDSTMAALVLRSDAEAAILADREKRAQAAQPVAWAATSEHGVVEALGMNQSRRFDTPLYFAAPTEASKPVQAEAPTASNERTVLLDANLVQQAVDVLIEAGFEDAGLGLQRAITATQQEAQPQAEPAGGDKEDADKYRLIRRGQHWSVIDGIGNTLRGDGLDAAVDAIRAAQQATGERG